jgi:hypothetical protein
MIVCDYFLYGSCDYFCDYFLCGSSNSLWKAKGEYAWKLKAKIATIQGCVMHMAIRWRNFEISPTRIEMANSQTLIIVFSTIFSTGTGTLISTGTCPQKLKMSTPHLQF